MKKFPKLIGETSRPLICVPIVGKDTETLLAEMSTIFLKMVDIIEWRADFFQKISDADAVFTTAANLKKAAPDIPFIFTIRSTKEGGENITLTNREIIKISAAVCQNGGVEYVDCELGSRPEDIEYLRSKAHKYNVKVIASFHDFDRTPVKEILLDKIAQAVEYKLDAAKIAVTPKNMNDVLTLFGVTLDAKNKYDIPIIAVSMGKYGAITRLAGGLFGSALTFAKGQNASAPGQISVQDLKAVLDIIHN
jgi:3-dehydroquinate dehydratase-1